MTNDSRFIVIFTDLDGTLLDQISYGWEDAKPALNLCKRLHIPVVPVSSKTGAEIDAIRCKLGLTSPFISENGGGIFFPTGGDYRPPSGTIIAYDIGKWSLGVPYDFVVRAFREIRNELGWKLRGFSEMTPEEISHLTGLDLETSLLASEREYDEPFIVLEQDTPDINALHAAARRRGLKITTGGRF
ncbi:MAG: HAD hydrolase family protein, partial [Thermodesulfobacteriota bacterium]|nr:HAD hydrolase family protein [Thermodesulfobacteriota bacterium]